MPVFLFWRISNVMFLKACTNQPECHLKLNGWLHMIFKGRVDHKTRPPSLCGTSIRLTLMERVKRKTIMDIRVGFVLRSDENKGHRSSRSFTSNVDAGTTSTLGFSFIDEPKTSMANQSVHQNSNSQQERKTKTGARPVMKRTEERRTNESINMLESIHDRHPSLLFCLR